MPGALDNFERNPAFHEKLAIDADIEPVRNVMPANKQAFRQIDCSWVKKRTRVFLSLRGDLRKFHGAAFPIRSSYALGPKDKDAAKITNRRIRRHALDEDMCRSYSYYKKLYGPLIDEIW